MDPAIGDPTAVQTPRAGRRAGKHVAIMDLGPGSTTEVPAGASSGQPLQQRISQRDLQHDRAPQPQQEAQPQSLAPEQQQQATGPPAKRVGFAGFGENDGGEQQQFAGVSRRKQEQMQQVQIAESKQRSKYDDRAIEGVMDIPELEEEGKEDITRIVAQAPKSHAPRVQAMSELEQDQGWLPVKSESEDIDLSLLTVCLLPSEQVIEPPDVWDYDLVFSQLKAELQNEGGGGESREGAEELRQI